MFSNNRRPKFKKKIALITGASGLGVGTNIARVFAKNNIKVYINGRDEKKLKKIAGDIVAKGGECSYFIADISDKRSAKEMFESLIKQAGKIDILVNNAAGDFSYEQTEKLSKNQWHKNISTILDGSFYCCKYAIPSMRKNRNGRIIFISSSAALRGTWGRDISYAAAKAGLLGMTKQLALELAKFNINVNAIAPSQILTPRVMRKGRKTKESIVKYCKNNVPMRRPAYPIDLANLALFLSLPESSYITGQIIHLDGGSYLASNKNKPINHEN